MMVKQFVDVGRIQFLPFRDHQIAMGTIDDPVADLPAPPRLSPRGLAFGIPAWKVDGMDPLAVMLATEQALALMRAGQGPTIIDADVYRYFHQNGPRRGRAFGQRRKDEETKGRGRGTG